MISMDKKYRTRAGQEVKIFMVDGGGSAPVIGAVKRGGEWDAFHWPADGCVSGLGFNADLDLIEVKPRIKKPVFVNLFRVNGDITFDVHPTLIESKRYPRWQNPIARVEFLVDCEEGEGL